jgi:hypothetical protein
MFELLKIVVKHCATGIDGQTYDPARVVGYGSAAMVVSGFVFNGTYVAIAKGLFDAQAFGLGGAAILAGVASIGAGVAAKAKSEPPLKQEN